MVDLKTFLGLAIPNQYCQPVLPRCQKVNAKVFLGQEIPNFHDPYIQYYYCTL